ncbi:MAG: VOC family protein [Actinobacteria bacterium]|nr:VOC family protein [Actinomycetota bacterium]
MTWLGIRTDRYEETVELFRDIFGLEPVHSERGCIGLGFPDGSKMEIFAQYSRHCQHFTTGPVVGLLVDNVHQATEELRAKGIEIVAEPGDNYYAHFRGPDGRIYEINDSPRPSDEP